MSDKTTVGDVVKLELNKAGVPFSDAAKWIGVGPSTFSAKIARSTFYAEEVKTIFDNLGIGIELVPEVGPVNKKLGGIGPRVRAMVNKTIYDTGKSTALCHTEWCDGWRMELFVDPVGNFFVVHYTAWDGASHVISEIGKADAMVMYAKYGDGTQASIFA